MDGGGPDLVGDGTLLEAFFLAVGQVPPLLADHRDDFGVGGFLVLFLDVITGIHHEEDVSRERLLRSILELGCLTTASAFELRTTGSNQLFL